MSALIAFANSVSRKKSTNCGHSKVKQLQKQSEILYIPCVTSVKKPRQRRNQNRTL